PVIYLLSFVAACSSFSLSCSFFPTRRSSDLLRYQFPPLWGSAGFSRPQSSWQHTPGDIPQHPGYKCDRSCRCIPVPAPSRRPGRSEEHTSELQSRFDLVCRLLLEKKKTH